MWANAQRGGRPAEYRWRPVLNAAVWLAPTAQVPCSNATKLRERKTWRMQSQFCTWQNSVTEQEPQKCLCSVPAQETAKYRAKFGWLPFGDVAALTLPRRETR